jgi:hypothetical protein
MTIVVHHLNNSRSQRVMAAENSNGRVSASPREEKFRLKV